MTQYFKTHRDLLDYLNTTNTKLHTAYERLFWDSYMGDHSVDEKMNAALSARDSFRSDTSLSTLTDEFHKKAKGEEKKKLGYWKLFFSKYQAPEEVKPTRQKITELESKIRKIRGERKEGYVDPTTGVFIEASENKLRTMMRTHADEEVRKACFNASEAMAVDVLDDYVNLIGLRNEMARQLGYEDFYAYKIELEEAMTKKELFGLFDAIYENTKYAFKNIRKLEKQMPGLRKPWNFGYMMTGDFTKEEDPYFQFEEALIRWGTSFVALGVDFAGGKLTLDLLDRKGKWNNGFCHWPDLVHYEGKTRIPGSARFTCNVVKDQVGSGSMGMHTLFHEGGHAAHLLNSSQTESCLNHEYPPACTSWDETQSMFMDTLFSSIEWKTRYALNSKGESYPLELYQRKLDKIFPLIPLDLMAILFVSNFEREIYEAKNLTKEKVLQIARKAHKKHFDREIDSLHALNVPHIYSFDSSAGYHGYGLAELAVTQWREYFYKKYGYIVDNPDVGKEMKKVWALGAALPFKEFVKLATGKKLSAAPFIKEVTKTREEMFKSVSNKLKKMENVSRFPGPVKFDAFISMVHGKEKIADNKKSFESMALTYKKWLKK